MVRSPPRRLVTHQDGGIVGYTRRRWLLALLPLLCNFDVLHISPSEHNVVEFLLGGRDEVGGFSVFGAKGEDIFESDRRVFGVYFLKGA
jgi:hypothetical protein